MKIHGNYISGGLIYGFTTALLADIVILISKVSSGLNNAQPARVVTPGWGILLAAVNAYAFTGGAIAGIIIVFIKKKFLNKV